MQNRKTHFIFLLLALFTMSGLLSSCSRDEVAEPVSVDDDSRASLVLYAKNIESTRSGSGSKAIESINSLRIVILRPDNTIEHNEYFGNHQNGTLYSFFVQPDEPKKVILIANEYNVAGFNDILASYTTGSTGFMEAAQGITFEFDATKNIPMTGVYDVPAIGVGESGVHTFHVVRAVTKFNFDFINNRDKDVVVSAVSISKLAGTSYLFPQFTRNGIWRYDESKGFVQDGFVLDGTGYTQWELWLKVLVEKQMYNTAFDRTGQVYSDIDGWIMDYNIPNQKEQTTKTIINEQTPFEVEAQSSKALNGNFYYAESKNLMDNSLYMKGFEQSYDLRMTVGDKNGSSYTFTRSLPNLRALFRNTHVMVTVVFGTYGNDDEVYAHIEPWEIVQEVDGTLEEEVTQ